MAIRTLPTVNNNGSTRDSLIELRLNAVRALRDAGQALLDMSPHGRDYQTVDISQFEAARTLNGQRFLAINTLANEIEKEALELHDELR